jgi:ribose 5-phosphate isomerase A
MDPIEEIKKKAAVHAASFVEHGATIGLGTGSTVYWLIQELSKRISQGLELSIVPTSKKTAELAAAAGMRVVDLNEAGELTLTIDGADEIDPDGQLIKGGGGALLQEKIVASASARLIIIADSSKLVSLLGKFPLPVEVIPFGYRRVMDKIMSSGICRDVQLRMHHNQPFVTDHQHYILDCAYDRIDNPGSLNKALHGIPGVVETGLFIDMTSEIIVSYPDNSIELIRFS